MFLKLRDVLPSWAVTLFDVSFLMLYSPNRLPSQILWHFNKYLAGVCSPKVSSLMRDNYPAKSQYASAYQESLMKVCHLCNLLSRHDTLYLIVFPLK